jgi:pimeloyl-ACP methyl ester carboxylesterase
MHRNVSQRTYGLDRTVTLEINGTRQRVRLCAARNGMPPLLIVQAGPGFPLLNEAAKFQQRLDLEQYFSVVYWDQRGCGKAALQDTKDISLGTQINDAGAIVRWLAEETQQQVIVFGISLGATIALEAAAREPGNIKAMVAVSIDTDTSSSDAAALSFLRKSGEKKVARSIPKLEMPPYITPQQFQSRARLLTDLGAIEHGKRFGELLRALLYSLLRTYGLFGTFVALRNMNAVQRKLLPELANLNLFTNWRRTPIPVHYIFGSDDALTPSSIVQRVSGLITKMDTLTTVPDAGHMVHFDKAAIVRSIILQALGLENIQKNA